ncbi:membrane-associated kinase regulator 5 [Pyrus ussuriensis x Pyrus communis]|uniref:Membrane-associated kinase regulator 5 n=1 Tax=Pyrus ussuriensis x Pyrus communis TaxID=2448454 RepID=A0A5N5F6Z9_9ROSA|nr:membrane-associated kinase regulator 5 [Pyrus ussuriensis x Pyrus communis]
METLYFLKFWKPNASTATPPNSSVAKENDVEEEEEDSFFDLELSFDLIQTPQANNIFESKPKSNTSDKTAGKPTLSLSTSDPISKRKILPIEPVSKPPQSPIALLKSAPKFGALMLKKPRQKIEKKTGEKAEPEVSMESHKQKTKVVIAKQLAGEEAQNPTKLTRENSSRRSGIGLQNPRMENQKTERFCKDVLQKYLNLIKPLYSKVSRSSTEKVKPSVDSPTASPRCRYSLCVRPKGQTGELSGGI